ncbi:hypothetical protein AC579_3548 [Pseudocercospora musae]|uniref:Uncharacterized protein n=1 Tax=Pseudocercospora musae TaxID=113226 RepID=A0A139IWG6_9PEZI|nr:hypothetical protein AC579_3548 [Pseudocercospora musae]
MARAPRPRGSRDEHISQFRAPLTLAGTATAPAQRAMRCVRVDDSPGQQRKPWSSYPSLHAEGDEAISRTHNGAAGVGYQAGTPGTLARMSEAMRHVRGAFNIARVGQGISIALY